jgi:hypothetical protein
MLAEAESMTISGSSLAGEAQDTGRVVEAPRLPFTFFLVAPVEERFAITDQGRAIPLFRYETQVLPRPGQQLAIHSPRDLQNFLRLTEQQFFATTKQDPQNVRRLMNPHPVANCHGWVFLAGQFGIEDALIPALLDDNGYRAVLNPQPGDLVIYEVDDAITHSGIVRGSEGGEVLVESKWGPLGAYLHAADRQPFAKSCAFYRSARRGHALPLR